MPIDNVLASLAVNDITRSARWYAALFGREGEAPMKELREWSFPRGGALQVYELPQRAGTGSCTLAVSDLEEQVRKLQSLGIDTGERQENARVKTLMVTDPDGNHIAFAQALDTGLAR